MVTATSSGSRGVYGAVSAAGEWGLKRGCAVAYTDKGTGNGAHELDTNTITLINGLTANATSAGNTSHFTATLTDLRADRIYRYQSIPLCVQARAFASQSGKRLGLVHAAGDRVCAVGDQRAVCADGAGNDQQAGVIPAVQHAGHRRIGLQRRGAALAAAEGDTTGLIDGVVVGEPQINVVTVPAGLIVARGGVNYPAAAIGRPLYDYTSLANLLQPCAAHSPTVALVAVLTTIPTSVRRIDALRLLSTVM